MEYKARITHLYKEKFGYKRMYADVDTRSSETDISDGEPPFYYQVGDVATPSISVSLNKVTITCQGASEIRYTTDGSTPTITSTKYTGPFSITKTTTVKAVGVLGELLGAVATKSCTYIAPPSVPSFSVADNIVTITCSGSDKIYYTIDGSEPDNSKTVYSAPFAITSAVTVKAVGYKSGIKGTVGSHQCTEYVAPPAAPTISCSNNTVTITVSGTATYYTTDGTEPDNTKTAYSAPFAISQTVTVKAVSYSGNIKGSIATQQCTYTAPEETQDIVS